MLEKIKNFEELKKIITSHKSMTCPCYHYKHEIYFNNGINLMELNQEAKNNIENILYNEIICNYGFFDYYFKYFKNCIIIDIYTD